MRLGVLLSGDAPGCLRYFFLFKAIIKLFLTYLDDVYARDANIFHVKSCNMKQTSEETSMRSYSL